MPTETYKSWFRNFVEEILNEQAKTRAEAESKITDLGSIIIQHLIKVLAFGPKCRVYNHWMKELNTWFNAIWEIKLKPKSYRPPLKDIKKWAHDEYIETEFDYKNFVDSAIGIEWELGTPIADNLVRNSYNEFNSLYDSILAKCANGKYNKEVLYTIIENWFNVYSNYYK